MLNFPEQKIGEGIVSVTDVLPLLRKQFQPGWI
jgi:hypothetical protein